MKFNLYEVVIQRNGHKDRGYIVAPSQEIAALVVVERSEALGLTQEDFSLEQVDKNLNDELRLGLDAFLRSAPVGFASYCDLGWVAHAGLVERLQLFGTKDPRGNDVFAVAPNIDIAAAIFSNTLMRYVPRPHEFSIYEAMASLPADRVRNVRNLLALGPIGIAEFDEEEDRWFVW